MKKILVISMFVLVLSIGLVSASTNYNDEFDSEATFNPLWEFNLNESAGYSWNSYGGNTYFNLTHIGTPYHAYSPDDKSPKIRMKLLEPYPNFNVTIKIDASKMTNTRDHWGGIGIWKETEDGQFNAHFFCDVVWSNTYFNDFYYVENGATIDYGVNLEAPSDLNNVILKVIKETLPDDSIKVDCYRGTESSLDFVGSITLPNDFETTYIGLTVQSGNQNVKRDLLVDWFRFEGYLPDSDGDGIPDYKDNCPSTPPGQEVGPNGCSSAQFCSQIVLSADKKDPNRKLCVGADWKDNEATNKKGKKFTPDDCYIEKNIKKDPLDDVCLATSTAD